MLYDELNRDIQARKNKDTLHIANAFFVPRGDKVFTPNFVKQKHYVENLKQEIVDCKRTEMEQKNGVKQKLHLNKNARNTLWDWTQEKSELSSLSFIMRFNN